jgi:hypothetical protein
MNTIKEFIKGNKILVILDANNDILVFDIIKKEDKEWITEEGKNLSTGKEIVVTVFPWDNLLVSKE